MSLRVVLVVGRTGVGGLREVVEVRRQRLDEGLETTSLGMDLIAYLLASGVGGVHGAIVAELSPPEYLDREPYSAQAFTCSKIFRGSSPTTLMLR